MSYHLDSQRPPIYICNRIITSGTGGCGSRGSSVSIVTGYGLDNWGSVPNRGRVFFFQSLRPDRLWGPLSLLSNGYWGSFPRGKARLRSDADHSPPSSAKVKYE
jgi:hypothetical protein